MVLAGQGLGRVTMTAYAVDVTWYRGNQPSGMSGTMPVGGSAVSAQRDNLYGSGPHAGGSTDLQAGSAAAMFAQRGVVPLPDQTDWQGSSQARLMGFGSPVGVITPATGSIQYTDMTNGNIWVSTGTTPQSWTRER